MKKVLNNNMLKLIAVLAMVLDHIAIAFVPIVSVFYYILRIIGRITAPVMFFGIANGYRYTSSRFKYGCRLLLFALLSQIPYSLFLENKLFLPNNFNVIFTLFLGFLCLCAIYDIKSLYLKLSFILICLFLSCFCEYGVFGIVLIIMFYIIKDNKWKISLYSLLSFFYMTINSMITNSLFTFVIYTGLFLVVPLLYLYNGKKGNKNLKYLFYLFYPIHLLILVTIKILAA